MQTNKTQVTAAIQIARAAYEAIAASGPNGILSGHLYAAMLSVFAEVQTYNSLIDLLIRSGLIERRANHLLVAL